MYRAFTILIPLVGAFGGAGYLGFWLGARRKPPDLTSGDRQRLLKAHADMLGKAREAHLNGELGLAMMYEEAADTLWKEIE